MANDINLNNDDMNFDELDKVLESDLNTGLDDNKDNIDNTNGPVESVLANVKQSITDTVKPDELINISKEVAKKTLPKSIENPVNNVLNIMDTVKQDTETEVSEFKSALADTLGIVKKITGDNGIVGDAINKVLSWLSPSTDTGYSEEDEDERIRKQASEVISDIVNEESVNSLRTAILESMQSKSEKSLLAIIASELSLLNKTNLKLSDSYYRKSLELQIKQLLLTDKLYRLHHEKMNIFVKQLEAIVKNTGLPDLAKLKTGEYVKHLIKDRLIDGGISVFKDSDFFKDLKESLVSTIRDKVSTASTTLGMFNSMAGMLDMMDGMEDLGMSKEQMFIDMLVKSVVASGAVTGSKVLIKKLLQTEKGKDVERILEKFESDPRNAINELKGYIEQSNNKRLESLLPILEYVVNATNKSEINGLKLMSEHPDDPTAFDNKTKKAITVVIPTLLSKIHRELIGIRTGKLPNKELVYDYYKNRFTDTKEIKTELLKTTLKSSKAISKEIETSSIFPILEKENKLTRQEREELQQALIDYLAKGGSTSSFYLEKEGLLDNLSETTRSKLKQTLDKINNENTLEAKTLRKKLQDELNEIKNNIERQSQDVYKNISKINALGRTDILEEANLVKHGDHTEVTSDLMRSYLDKFTSRYLTGRVDITNLFINKEKARYIEQIKSKLTSFGIKNIDSYISKLYNLDTDKLKYILKLSKNKAEFITTIKNIDKLESNNKIMDVVNTVKTKYKDLTEVPTEVNVDHRLFTDFGTEDTIIKRNSISSVFKTTPVDNKNVFNKVLSGINRLNNNIRTNITGNDTENNTSKLTDMLGTINKKLNNININLTPIIDAIKRATTAITEAIKNKTVELDLTQLKNHTFKIELDPVIKTLSDIKESFVKFTDSLHNTVTETFNNIVESLTPYLNDYRELLGEIKYVTKAILNTCCNNKEGSTNTESNKTVPVKDAASIYTGMRRGSIDISFISSVGDKISKMSTGIKTRFDKIKDKLPSLNIPNLHKQTSTSNKETSQININDFINKYYKKLTSKTYRVENKNVNFIDNMYNRLNNIFNKKMDNEKTSNAKTNLIDNIRNSLTDIFKKNKEENTNSEVTEHTGLSFLRFFKRKKSELLTQKDRVLDQLEEYNKDIMKEINKEGIDRFLKSRLAMVPLPRHDEEVPFYESILRGIDPNGVIEKHLAKAKGGLSKVFEFMKTLHISALKDAALGMIGGMGNLASHGIDGINNLLSSWMRPLYGLLPESIRNKLDNTVIGRFIKGEVNVFKELGKGVLKAGKNFITTNLRVIKDTAKETLIDKNGRLRLNAITLSKFLGKSFFRTAKATGEEVIRPIGKPVLDVLTETGKHSTRLLARFLGIEKHIPIYRRRLIVDHSPLPEEVKRLYNTGKIKFKDIPEYLNKDEIEVWYKYLKEWKKVLSNEKGINITGLVSKLSKMYIKSATITGKNIRTPIKDTVSNLTGTTTGITKELLFGDIRKVFTKETTSKVVKTKDKIDLKQDRKIFTLFKEYKDIGTDEAKSLLREFRLVNSKKIDKNEYMNMKILTILDSIKNALKPKKKSVFDRDGDGIRDGSWREILKHDEVKKDKHTSNLLKRIIPKVNKTTTGLFSGLTLVGLLIANKIKSIFKDGFWSGMKKIFWEPIKWLAGKIWDGIKSLGKTILDGIKHAFTNIVDSVKNKVTNVVHKVKDKVTDLWHGAKNVVGNVFGFFKNKLSSVYHTVTKSLGIQKIYDLIKHGAASVFNVSKDLIAKSWKTVKEVTTETGSKLLNIALKTKDLGKLAGKFVFIGGKKIPLLGLVLGGGAALYYALKGDWEKAGLNLASGALSTIPGPGTAASIAIDTYTATLPDLNQSTPNINYIPNRPSIIKDPLLEQQNKLNEYKKRFHLPNTNGNILEEITNKVSSLNIPLDVQHKKQLAYRLVKEEGISFVPYKDSLGKTTIGIGHLLRPSDLDRLKTLKTKGYITPEETANLFINDIKRITNALLSKAPWIAKLPANIKTVLLDMAFNLGPNGLLGFKKALQYLKVGDIYNAINEFKNSRWYQQVPNRAEALLNTLLESANDIVNTLNNNQNNGPKQPPTIPRPATVTVNDTTPVTPTIPIETKLLAKQTVSQHLDNKLKEAEINKQTAIHKEHITRIDTTNDLLEKQLFVQQAMLKELHMLNENIGNISSAYNNEDKREKNKQVHRYTEKEYQTAISLNKEKF